MTRTQAQRARRAARYAARAPTWCAVCHRPLKGRCSRQTCSDRCRQVRSRGAGFQRALRGGSPAPGSLRGSVVEQITIREAASVIERYEPMPAVSLFAFGLFLGGELAGAVVYSPEPCENLGVWRKFGFDGRIILLSRGACLPWAPKGSGSRLIRRSMRLLPDRFEVVTGVVDPTLGEVGAVYQAAGFDHVVMSKPGGRFRAAGTSSRTLRRRGLSTKAAILEAGLTPRREHQKGRYFAFRGPHADSHRSSIQHLIRPPPRRVDRPRAL